MADAALENALIQRHGHGPQRRRDPVIRSDGGLVFAPRAFRRTVRHHGLRRVARAIDRWILEYDAAGPHEFPTTAQWRRRDQAA